MTEAQKKILIRLKGQSKHGDISKVVHETGYTRQYVGKCLSPFKKEYSKVIVKAMIKVIKERLKAEEKEEKQDRLSLEELKDLFGE